jgi:cytochrome c peroxidase
MNPLRREPNPALEMTMKTRPLPFLLAAAALAAVSGTLLAQGMGGIRGGMGALQPPADNPITPAKVALGNQLYFDGRLSRDGTVSCNSCHDLGAAGADNKPVSTGVGGAQGSRNSPTVWNSAFHSAQFWDGRARSLEEQAKGPLTNPAEMAMPSEAAVVARVQAIPGYVSQFDTVFGKNGVNIDNIAKAIATYERTLVSGASAFDAFRFADKSTLTQAQSEGFQTFRDVGCVQCHMGPDFAGPPPLARGAGFYQRFPLFPAGPLAARYKLLDDPGRMAATGQTGDKNVWRVPSMRNVALTAPYFHNGMVPTLEEAVRVCAEGGNNRSLSPAQVSSITAFLGSLSGSLPSQQPPKLP